MNIFRTIIYAIVWTLVLLSNNIFYSRTVVRNRKNLKIKNPTIFVSNHPNTLLDPLIVALRMNKFVHFLINASLFKNAVLAWFWRNSVGIKVERKEDAGDGKVNNEETFRFAENFLINGGVLYIAPEGGSDIPRRLRKLKTGTGRIALSTANRMEFDGKLEILPVGLNYQKQTDFRTKVFINIGEGIKISDFEDQYREDNFQAALAITAEMDKQIRALIIDTKDDEEDAFLRKLETICQSENKLSLGDAYDRGKKLLVEWRNFLEEKKQTAHDFSKQVNQYFSFLEKNKTRDHVVKKIQASNSKLTWWLRSIFMVLSFPVFVYGWVNNFLANYIPAMLYKKSGLHPAYTSAVKILSGILTYSIFYGIQISLVKYFFDGNWVGWIYVASLIITGLFAWWYKDFAKNTLSGWSLFNDSKKEIIENFENRKNIVEVINNLLSEKMQVV